MAAAAVVSVSMGVMKPVLHKLATLMGKEYKKIKGLRRKVNFLKCELGDINALLEEMDNTDDELGPLAKNWRRDIIEMSYNIEDRIDDFMCTVGEADGKIGILQKATKYLQTFKNRRRLANDLQEMETQVMEASERRKRYMLDQRISVTAHVNVDPRMTALYQESTSLVGIESQRDELVNWATDGVKQLKFLAIVGFGGIGKTTLAKEVYHLIGGKFECQAFISVSQKPKMIVLFKSLRKKLQVENNSPDCQLQDHIDSIRKHLQNKRYLIVVDDLWNMQDWQNVIQHAFPRSSHSSRVIITTRDENVAATTCCHNDGQIHKMRLLSEQHSRMLFFDRVFGSEDACPSDLMKPSCEILNKCDRLPLAIITMASMLAHQPKELETWKNVLRSLGTKSATNSAYKDMIYILDLSYKNLPRHLKSCFLYLGSYPEDYEINRDELVRRWVAEGFVSNSDDNVWDVAEGYFNELVNRSMIQPIYMKIGKYLTDVVSGCRVHDMLLELIVSRCKEDNFLSLVNDVEAQLEAPDRVIRRLTVASTGDTWDSKVDTSISQVRSLAILGESNSVPSLKFKYIRVLILRIRYVYKRKIDLTCINQLAMLRYLEVSIFHDFWYSADDIAEDVTLPAQIRGLPYLETLDLSGLSGLPFNCTIPTEIIDVPRLSHLLMPAQNRMWCMTRKVRSLRTLHGFHARPDSLESIVGLGELTALSDLEFYFPRWWALLEKKTEYMAALSNSLEKLCNLRRLRLSTMKREPHEPIAWCTVELSSLSPPFRKIEHLEMAGCRFSRVPKWIGHLRKLRVLHLGVKQIFQEDVAMIGRGSLSLIELRLQITSILTERIVIGGSMGFPLVKLFKFDCDWISYLTFEEGAMPELRELNLVFDADKWDKVAPRGLQHLQKLEKIDARWSEYNRCIRYSKLYNETEAEDKGSVVTAVFQEASAALLTRPTFTFYSDAVQIRPTEEDDYLMEHGVDGCPPRSWMESLGLVPHL